MKAICELATLECYYHNVAKYKENDAEGILIWKKDKNFWIEYSGVVKVGIDMSVLDIEVNGDKVTITLPEAKILSIKVDETTLTKDSYIIAKDSASIEAADQKKAYEVAEDNMLKSTSGDIVLLKSAQQRAKLLLEEYIKNIEEITGKEYSIEWIYIENKDNT